ncbi:putative glycolipid-binding domain-containing protein [soil metagenome]
MTREMIWSSGDAIGSEYLSLQSSAEGVSAESVCFANGEVQPSRVRYRVVCDSLWRVRDVTVAVERPFGAPHKLHLISDGEGQWHSGEGEPLTNLEGCIDIDPSCSPVTNTLPIRRHDVQPEQVEGIRVTFIHVPSLAVEPWNQRYTGISGRSVRYETVDDDFRRDLEIDSDGLVVEYPGLFTRGWSR